MASYQKKSITGWKWVDIGDFNTDLDALNLALGIPVSPGAVTQTAMAAIANEVDDVVDFYYVGYNPQFVATLGDPELFDVDILIPDVIPPTE